MASMKYVGLDVHKESIAVAVADEGPADVRFHGTIGATTEALRKLVRRLGSPETLRFAYEAGRADMASIGPSPVWARPVRWWRRR